MGVRTKFAKSSILELRQMGQMKVSADVSLTRLPWGL